MLLVIEYKEIGKELHFTDSPEEVHEILNDIAIDKFGLQLNDLNEEQLQHLDDTIDIIPHSDIELPSHYV